MDPALVPGGFVAGPPAALQISAFTFRACSGVGRALSALISLFTPMMGDFRSREERYPHLPSSSLSCYIHPSSPPSPVTSILLAAEDIRTPRAEQGWILAPCEHFTPWQKKKKKKMCHGFWHRKGRWRWGGRGSARCKPARSVGVICSALSHRACFCISVGA